MSGMEFDEAWQHASRTQGWLSWEQSRVLFRAARTVQPGRWIVEIGSHCGRSTVLLAAAKSAEVNLLAVDPFDDPRWGGGPEALVVFERSLRSAGLLDCVQVFRGLSSEAASAGVAGCVGMLFVDGAHDRSSVLADIDGWSPHLAEDAPLFFHDAYSSPGVTVSLFERFFASNWTRYIGSSASLARFDHQPMGFMARLASATRMVARLPWFVRNVIIKVALRRQWAGVHRTLGHPGTEHPY